MRTFLRIALIAAALLAVGKLFDLPDPGDCNPNLGPCKPPGLANK